MELHVAHSLNLIDDNKTLHIIRCNGLIKYCTLNPFGRKAICASCRIKAQALIDHVHTISNKVNVISIDENIRTEGCQKVSEDIYTVLKNAVLSGIASHTRISEEKYLSLKWINSKHDIQDAAIKQHKALSRIIKIHSIDELYCFNGRFSCSKAAIYAASVNKINYIVYDLNRGFNHYSFRNKSLHSISENTKRAVDLYNKDPTMAEKTADTFYKRKRLNLKTYEESYTKSQKKGLVTFDEKLQIVSIFTSSDDEYRYIGSDWGEGTVVVDQIEEIKVLIDGLNDKYNIIVRMHPNQGGMPRRMLDIYNRELSHRCKLVLPASKIDTYEIMDRSDYVVTFCSLIGPEAIYADKKLVTIGSSPYVKLNIGINVSNGFLAAKVIVSGKSKMDKNGAIIWANYLMSYNDKLPGFINHGNGNCSIYGINFISYRSRSIALLVAKTELFFLKSNGLSLRTVKNMIQRVISFLDGKVRGEHEIK
jgi:hypothetical protein